MDILRRARQLEAEISRRFERTAQRWTGAGPREPLEITHAIVEALADRLEPAPRGKHVFPFNRIVVSIVAASGEARARFAAVLDSEPSLERRILTHLRENGCEPPPLDVSVVYVERPGLAWVRQEFEIELDRVAAKPAPPPREPLAPPQLDVTVVHGAAEQPRYVLALPRINLGRCAEVRDDLNRLLRTNHVVFVDGSDAANATVSRRHAHIDYDESGRLYRIADDRSAHGTSVVRNGATIAVPAGSRGLRLESGDEIVLGQARARVTIE